MGASPHRAPGRLRPPLPRACRAGARCAGWLCLRAECSALLQDRSLGRIAGVLLGFLSAFSRCCVERGPEPAAHPPAARPLTPTPQVLWVQFHATPSVCALGLPALSLLFCQSCKTWHMSVPAVCWVRVSALARSLGPALWVVPDTWAHLGAPGRSLTRRSPPLRGPPVAGLPGAPRLSRGGEACRPGAGARLLAGASLGDFGRGGARPC